MTSLGSDEELDRAWNTLHNEEFSRSVPRSPGSGRPLARHKRRTSTSGLRGAFTDSILDLKGLVLDAGDDEAPQVKT
jgi:hypothetical protein